MFNSRGGPGPPGPPGSAAPAYEKKQEKYALQTIIYFYF